MEFITEITLFIHVAVGFVGLFAFWVPVFTRKGQVNHVRFGKIFVWSGYILLAAAAIALSMRLIRMLLAGTGPTEAPVMYGFIVFLGYLTLVTFATIWQGMRVLEHKRDRSGLKTPFTRGVAWLSIAASVGVIAYGILMQPGNRILLFALSPIGLLVGRGMLQYMNNLDGSPRGWWYEHLGAMLGAGIAFHTAFAVFGASRLFDIGLTGWVAVVPWVLPTIIGLPATFLWTRYYQKKFGELGKAT